MNNTEKVERGGSRVNGEERFGIGLEGEEAGLLDFRA